MRVLPTLSTSLCLAMVSYFPLANAADLPGGSEAQSAPYGHSKKLRSAHTHEDRRTIKSGGTVRQTMPDAPHLSENLAWKTHAPPKGNWFFTRYGINGTYPDDY